MGLREKIAHAAEQLNLTEKVYVTVGIDRKRVRPAPGTILVEVLGGNGETLTIDTIATDTPALRGAWHVNGKPCTYVQVGDTGHAHQAFRCSIEDTPFELPEHIRSKTELGAKYLNVWWSCEDR